MNKLKSQAEGTARAIGWTYIILGVGLICVSAYLHFKVNMFGSMLPPLVNIIGLAVGGVGMLALNQVRVIRLCGEAQEKKAPDEGGATGKQDEQQ
jgi:hypothetical protein